jgi:hypothetical protein
VENFSILRRQAASVPRLKLSDWPRSKEHGRSWPTFPTLNESWEMVNRGKLPHHRLNSERANLISPYRIPARQIKPGARERAIANLVVGVRASIEVPKGTLGYFRYRWGFLILKRKAFLPKKLCQWLANLWKVDITGLFLLYPVRYNDALRRLPSSTQWVLSGFCRGHDVKAGGRPPRRRKPK